MEAARRGDRRALEVLLTTHYDRVHALCRRMLGNDADALDATQDALLAAVKGLSRFDGRSAFGTWLYRIATNTCIDELRRRRRRPVVGFIRGGGSGGGSGAGRDGAGRDGDGGVDFDLIPPGGTVVSGQGFGDRDPADVAAARVDVDAALRELPLEFRTAVVLRDVCDLPYEEIAEILDVPVGTVRSRIARGRAALAAGAVPGNRPGGPGVQPNRTTDQATTDQATTDQEEHTP
ncbi:MAG: sigma-70 family RNA polymerase sigma factor [Acidimicrobiales bacterium]